jgi:hypothetical protein
MIQIKFPQGRKEIRNFKDQRLTYKNLLQVSFLERPERVMEGIPKIRLPSSNDPKGLWKGNHGKIESFWKDIQDGSAQDKKPLGWGSPDAMSYKDFRKEGKAQ